MRIWDFPVALAATLSAVLPGIESRILFSTSPVNPANLLREAFPVGNGRLGAMSFGQPSMEKVHLNHDSLWSGGPFESATYNGGNPTSEVSKSLQAIRETIFNKGTGDVAALLGNNNNYGSFRAMANLSVVISDIKSYSNFKRSLDMTNGMHTTVFTADDKRVYTSAVYCSYPAQVCVYRLSVSSGSLPNVAIGLENALVPSNLRNATCGVSFVRLNGVTQLGPPRGMEYDVIARLSTGPLGMPISSCSTNAPGTMVVTGSAYGPDEPLNTFSIIVGAQVDYDQTKCNAASRYSCKNEMRPGLANEKVTAAASTRLESKLFVAHQQNYAGLMNQFNLTLNDPWAKSKYPSEGLELFQLLDRYRATANVPLNKRSTDGKEEEKGESQKEKRKAEPWKPLEKRQFGATTITSTTTFPGFQFPTNLPAGFSPNTAIPWSSGGTIYLTDSSKGKGQPDRTITITLTRTTPTGRTTTPTQAVRPPPNSTPTVTWSTTRIGPTTQPKPQPSRPAGNPDAAEVADGGSYVEMLMFDYARHLFICSSRENSLPPNLQGVWSNSLETAWGGDYHTNINLQMNHWFANQVGLGELQQALFRFMKDTWAPRGRETAKLLYNAAGWVVHNEINIFGHTGMKTDAKWANYPAAAAWIAQHVYDHFDYTRDVAFLQNTGYILMRDIATFWLSQLQLDRFAKDNTLVANPCNSPETGPTTFGCAHFQQLIYQLFETTLSAGWAVNDADSTFTTSLDVYMASLDKGLYIGSWGEIKEWKLPDSQGYEKQGDTHRHLSHLVGWFPGYSVAAFQDGYANASVQRAVATSLTSRGPGKADENSGWEKVWRAACWARLNNTEQADYELRYAIASNFASNGLSQYKGLDGPFQIDANFGIAGAMLSMLVVDLPAAYRDTEKRGVVLGPAIPKRWGPGKVSGLRIRGGTSLEMTWNANGVVDRVSVTKRGEPVRFYSKKGLLIGEI